jgi:hypothetical protein
MRSEAGKGLKARPSTDTRQRQSSSTRLTPLTLLRSCSVSPQLIPVTSPAPCDPFHFTALLYTANSSHFHSLVPNTRLAHATASSEPSPYLNIKLPDLSTPLPEPEIHVVSMQSYESYDLSSQICSK